MPNTITVTGKGSIRVAPDRAIATVAVVTQGDDVDQARRENAAQMISVHAALRELGVPERALQTAVVAISPMYESTKRVYQQRIVGYRATNNLRVTLDDLELVGPALDAAVRAGANHVFGPHFTLQDEDSHRKRALELAMRNAREKADLLAAVAEVRLTGVRRVAEVDSSGGRGFARVYTVAEATPADAGTPVSAGEQEIEAQVQVTFLHEAS